jgi:hypothetical protein
VIVEIQESFSAGVPALGTKMHWRVVARRFMGGISFKNAPAANERFPYNTAIKTIISHAPL